MPTVSVIIPTYNRGHLLGRALQSVLHQTFTDLEIIIVDDGSNDKSESLVKWDHNPRIRCIRHNENKGVSAARNTGIEAARGKYIGFLDDDDEWLPEKLLKQIQAFKEARPETGIVYTAFRRIVRDAQYTIPSPRKRQIDGSMFKNLFWGNFITASAVLIKKECFEKAGMFDEELPSFQDWDLWLRMARHYPFAYIDEPLAIQYGQEDSLSSNSEAALPALDLIFAKYSDDMFKENKKLLAKRYRHYGKWFLKHHQLSAARKYFIKSLKIRPTDINCFIRLMRSFSNS